MVTVEEDLKRKSKIYEEDSKKNVTTMQRPWGRSTLRCLRKEGRPTRLNPNVWKWEWAEGSQIEKKPGVCGAWDARPPEDFYYCTFHEMGRTEMALHRTVTWSDTGVHRSISTSQSINNVKQGIMRLRTPAHQDIQCKKSLEKVEMCSIFVSQI